MKKTYSQDDINDKYRSNICPECNSGALKHTGKDAGGWVYLSICKSCNTEFQFQETDMGQSLPYLESNADFKKVSFKFDNIDTIKSIKQVSPTMIIGAIYVKEDQKKETIKYVNPIPFNSADSEEFRNEQENMTPKYYTPEIEEFHVGFECEVKYDNKWEQTIIKFGIVDPFLVASISRKNKLIHIVVTEDTMNEYRVKHLDREDIQECGWEFIEDDSVGDGNFRWFDDFKYQNYQLAYWGYMGEDFKFEKNESQIWNYKILIKYKNNIIFEGTLKNKSELKKIMLQLGIN